MEILGNNSKLCLEILGKSNLDTINEWDSKWIRVSVDINLNGFRANFKIELMDDDFRQFFDSLNSVLNKTSDVFEFKTLEESIYLKGKVSYSGLIEWEGSVQYPIGDGNVLSFKFESDYLQIEAVYDSLKKDLFF